MTKVYPSYKDSGVEWIGEVPEHWEFWKISHAFGAIGSGTTPPSNEPVWYDDGTVPWVTTGELREEVITDTAKRVTADALKKFSTLRLHPAGSLAIAMYGATIGRLGILGVSATTNQACCVLSLPKQIAVRFAYFWLLGFKQQLIDLYATGGGQPNINQDIISMWRIPTPMVPEQTAIAAFLDRETARIDTLIAAQRRLIDLLREKRSALISHVVTKGPDPNVKMKDSGVEWLGMVPEDWEVKPLKYVALMKSGDQITADEINESGEYPVFGGNGLRGYTSIYTHDGWFPLIGRQGALCGNVNYAKGKFWASEHAVVVSPQIDCNILWLGELLRTMNLGQYSITAAQPGLSVDVIGNLRIPFPQITEQTAIAAFLDRETAKIDALIGHSEKSITLAQERRSALISAAVTGKIDIRESA